jgi:hypothetical protein
MAREKLTFKKWIVSVNEGRFSDASNARDCEGISALSLKKS